MEDKEFIDVSSSPTESPVSVDLSSIINSLNDLVEKQGEIIDNQNKIIEYFVPTEEEIKIQNEQMKKEQEEQLFHEEQMKKELDDYNNQVLSTLKSIQDNTYNSLDVGTVSSANSWILLFVIVTVLFFGLLYKAIRAFI